MALAIVDFHRMKLREFREVRCLTAWTAIMLGWPRCRPLIMTDLEQRSLKFVDQPHSSYLQHVHEFLYLGPCFWEVTDPYVLSCSISFTRTMKNAYKICCVSDLVSTVCSFFTPGWSPIPFSMFSWKHYVYYRFRHATIFLALCFTVSNLEFAVNRGVVFFRVSRWPEESSS